MADNEYMDKFNDIFPIGRPVKPIKVRAYCGKCMLNGELNQLEQKDNVLLTAPVKYQYVCPVCKKEYTSTISYPFIKYVDDVDIRESE